VGHGLTYIDHLTHNVHRGRMKEWADFYERLFNFREMRYFDIEGQVTGVKSKAMTSPCGKIRIPINERATTRARSRSTWTCTTAKASSTSRWAPTTSTAPCRA
jgi:4-hydroxyphenylpyruvate dioxygenase